MAAPFSVRVTHDSLSPFLRRLHEELSNPTRVLRAMGTTLLAITKGNFNSAGAALRPLPWPNKRDGTPSILQRSTTLSKSFFLTVTPRSATVATSSVYAATHQFGNVIRPKPPNKTLRFQSGGRWWSVKQVVIPARPFFPIGPSGELTPQAAALILRAGERTLERLTG